jgi:anti-sigma factor RsiW
MSSGQGTTCSAAMELFHRVLDGDLMDAGQRQGMEAHLVVCSECAEKAEQLREMQDLLRGMAEQPMPDDARDEVLVRTVQAPRERPAWRRLDWRLAAAAAVVLFATWIGMSEGPFDRKPDDEALTAMQAAQDVRKVFQLTANALKRSEEAVFREVFAEKVSPALQKVGILWPQPSRKGDAEEGQI